MFMDVFDSVEKIKDRSSQWHGLRQKLAMVGRDDLIADLERALAAVTSRSEKVAVG